MKDCGYYSTHNLATGKCRPRGDQISSASGTVITIDLCEENVTLHCKFNLITHSHPATVPTSTNMVVYLDELDGWSLTTPSCHTHTSSGCWRLSIFVISKIELINSAYESRGKCGRIRESKHDYGVRSTLKRASRIQPCALWRRRGR